MKELNSLTRAIAVILISYGAWSVATFAGPMRKEATRQSKGAAIPRAAGLAAWQQVYSVLTNARCINCHTATNYPQQGDDRHRHFANVIRGPEGKGVAGLNCASCHQETNADRPVYQVVTSGTSLHCLCAGRTQTINLFRAEQSVVP